MKNTFKRVSSMLVATALLATCMNVAPIVQGFEKATARSANEIVQAHVWNQSDTGAGVLANDFAADMNSVGGTFEAGQYLSYDNIDFGQGENTTMLLTLSALAEQAGKKITVKLDGTDGQTIGTTNVVATNNNIIFKDHYISIPSITGVHDVYLVFEQATTLNIDFFVFSPYNGTETAEERSERMAWWNDARYGQFVHWGAYAQAGGEYQGRKTGYAEWAMKYLNISKEDYARDIAKVFNPTQFNPQEVVKLAKDAGQKYMVFTSRHHEGLSMYDTKIRDFKDYSLMSYGDYKGSDPLMGLAEECKKQGIKFGAYITIYDWHDYTQSNYGDKITPALKEEYKTRLKGQLAELIERYDVELLWFDGSWSDWWTREDGLDLGRYIRTLNPAIITNNRIGKTTEDEGDYVTPEQQIPENGADYDWESCMTLNGSWGYNKNDHNWKTANTVVTNLVDCASKGGNYLLNVGPDEQGNVPQGSKEVLLEAGKWMEKYGNSIYGTRKSCFKKLPSGVKATTKEGKVYLHLSNYLSNGTVILPNLKNEIKGIKVMGTQAAVQYSVTKSNTILELPSIIADPYDTVIEIDVIGTPEAAAAQENVNLAPKATSVKATNEYGGEYVASAATDGKDLTRWASLDNTKAATLELTFDQPVTVNTATILQYSSHKNIINNFNIEYWDGTDWKVGFTGGKVDSAARVSVSFNPITSDKIRLNMIDALNPSIYEFQLFNQHVSEVVITSPKKDENINILPFTVTGTAKGGNTVDLIVSGSDFVPIEYRDIAISENGTWSKTIDKLNTGIITLKAVLKDAEGQVETVSSHAINVLLLGNNLALNKSNQVSSYYDLLAGYEGDKALDGKLSTRWAPKDGDIHPQITVDFGQSTAFDTVFLSETDWSGSYRCKAFTIEYLDDSEWKIAYTGAEIGASIYASFPTVTSNKVRFTITDSILNAANASSNINEFQVFKSGSVAPSVDRTNLSKAIEVAATYEGKQADYTATSWTAFATALTTANNVFASDDATQDEVNAATAALNTAISGLTLAPPTPGDSNKTILKAVLDYANKAKASEEYTNAIDSVKVSFDTQLTTAQGVYDKADATQEQVNNAWMKLMNEIHKLGFQRGEKSQLAFVIAKAGELDLNDYVEAGQAEFKAMLKAAQDMLANGDAMQAEVDKAATDLVQAMFELRFKANKDILDKVLGEAIKLETSLYTAQSVKALQSAIDNGNAVMADVNATKEHVEEAVAMIEAARNGLVLIETPSTEKPVDKDDVTADGAAGKTDSATTGDTNAVVAMAALMLLAAGAVVFNRKKYK